MKEYCEKQYGKHLFIVAITFIALSACKKSNEPETTTTTTTTATTISAEMNLNNQKVSEISLNTKSTGVSSAEIITGQNYVDIIGNGEVLWFHFNAIAGELYKISWQDSWWEKYTAGSIYVTGFEEDKSTLYFQEERLLQMYGSPKVISIGNDGIVYLKVRGYDNEISGSFAINVEKLDLSLATALYCDSTLNFSVSAGTIKLCQIQVMKDSTYDLSIEGSEFIGAYGDDVSVKVSAFKEGLNDYYFLDELAKSPVHNGGQPNQQTFTALKTETVYLAAMGAYWWNPRSVSLSLTCQ